MAANAIADDRKLSYVAAQLQEQALKWFEKDQKLEDKDNGRINAWDNQTDDNTKARSFTTKFREEFIPDEQKEEKKRDWYFQWERMKQVPGESIDAYTKRYKSMIRK